MGCIVFLLLLAFFGYQSSGTLAGALTPIFFGVGLLLGPLPRKTDATAMTVEKTRP